MTQDGRACWPACFPSISAMKCCPTTAAERTRRAKSRATISCIGNSCGARASAGLRVFDYGRSKRGTGSFDFKKNWGFEPQPLHYEYLLVKGKRVPEHNPLNPEIQPVHQAVAAAAAAARQPDRPAYRQEPGLRESFMQRLRSPSLCSKPPGEPELTMKLEPAV